VFLRKAGNHPCTTTQIIITNLNVIKTSNLIQLFASQIRHELIFKNRILLWWNTYIARAFQIKCWDAYFGVSYGIDKSFCTQTISNNW
jgi:hypothetical protein